MAAHCRRGAKAPPLQKQMTIVGQNEIYLYFFILFYFILFYFILFYFILFYFILFIYLIAPFFLQNLLGPRPPPPSSSITSLGHPPPPSDRIRWSLPLHWVMVQGRRAAPIVCVTAVQPGPPEAVRDGPPPLLPLEQGGHAGAHHAPAHAGGQELHAPHRTGPHVRRAAGLLVGVAHPLHRYVFAGRLLPRAWGFAETAQEAGGGGGGQNNPNKH